MPKIPNWDKVEDGVWINRNAETGRETKLMVRSTYSNNRGKSVWEVARETIDASEWGETFSNRGKPLAKKDTKKEAMDFAYEWMRENPRPAKSGSDEMSGGMF